jgi:KDO2-lipid IV(A) lauroyltransferase
VHLAREAVVFFRLGGWSRERVVERTCLAGLEGLHRALKDHGGVLLLTGHLGNWEVGGAALAARGVPMDVVAKGMANRRFQEALFQTREELGMRVVEMFEAPRQVLRSLRSDRLVAIVGDQNAHRNGVFVPFFGVEAATARGPATFALRTGVPVFVAFAIRRPGWGQSYDIRIEPLAVERSGDLEEDIRAFTAAYMGAVEAAVRRHPEQYFWQHKRWKNRPGGASGGVPEEPAGDRSGTKP